MISDQGVGMRPEQLEELNAVLRDPPVTGLALGRSLGCLVAARLAARHGITVRLRASESDGVAAYVILPRHLLRRGAAHEPRRCPPARAGGRDRLAGVPGPRPSASRRRCPPTDFDAGLQALLEEEGPIDRLESEPARDPAPDSAAGVDAGGVHAHPPRPGRHHRGRCPSRAVEPPVRRTPTRCAACSPATAPASRPDGAPSERPTADEERS